MLTKLFRNDVMTMGNINCSEDEMEQWDVKV